MCVIFQGLEDLSGGLLHRQEAEFSGFSVCKIGGSTTLSRRPLKPYLRLLSGPFILKDSKRAEQY